MNCFIVLSFSSEIVKPKKLTRWLGGLISGYLGKDLMGLIEMLYLKKMLKKMCNLLSKSGKDLVLTIISFI